jgi:hypothetical protein
MAASIKIRRIERQSRSTLIHGNPDGHNDTRAPSRSLSPGKFGCSTFAYLVPYNYKPGVHISLLRSY